ncbi:MAG: exodeoxyribonuclease VII large subunit [Micavibrio aeruginosavorus]|uniref:Exodeoxyribonuclease 7 large subunit n=1 Tax=Micavibrio aeruginosavorus TaxID=349221 RepID=A0A7T5R2F8_9BACT|nr:MAG: exodeoxyribonuclease VII large subunit [Micavibrio aeruginosavorus]
MNSDLFSNPAPVPARSNVPELSVSELSGSIQRSLEESFGRVRVRGEIAGMKLAASGHLYADLKDENASISIICWRSTMQRLKIRPEEGLEVICTGKITTYPKSSRYQLIVDSIELAGAGALLKMLEDRKKKLAAEGLFDPARKIPLPYLPRVIGVVTSPTGAVIRDILHRLDDRFPRHVLVWPVLVQGEGAAEQIAGAIRGFDALPASGKVPRPDLLIVARGGGSLEDLMAFNEEAVVRAAADCSIPLISAVGHETDTTLIDYAADVRAPTPTAAAEMAVPVRAELLAAVMEQTRRLFTGMTRLIDHRRERVQGMAARLGDPQRLLATKTQSLDHALHRLDTAFATNIRERETRVVRLGAALRHPRSLIERESQRLQDRVDRLKNTAPRLISDKAQALRSLRRMLESLSFERVLDRGYVVVRDPADDRPLGESGQIASGQAVSLQFKGNQRRRALID